MLSLNSPGIQVAWMDVLLLHIDEMKTLELSKGSEKFLPKLCPCHCNGEHLGLWLKGFPSSAWG